MGSLIIEQAKKTQKAIKAVSLKMMSSDGVME